MSCDEAYGRVFARLYRRKWERFAAEAAPRILDFYGRHGKRRSKPAVLDLCCGTGRLALHFLNHGYPVTGLDRSQAMLHQARVAARPFVETGQARFVQADATRFTLDQRFGLVIATYDALNHLANKAMLESCFERVFAVNDEVFIFDLNTRRGLSGWNAISIDESEDAVVVTHKSFDPVRDRAQARFTCFLATADGLYERAQETVHNTAFALEEVAEMLRATGWGEVHFATLGDLGLPLAEPEEEPRVFVVARK